MKTLLTIFVLSSVILLVFLVDRQMLVYNYEIDLSEMRKKLDAEKVKQDVLSSILRGKLNKDSFTAALYKQGCKYLAEANKDETFSITVSTAAEHCMLVNFDKDGALENISSLWYCSFDR